MPFKPIEYTVDTAKLKASLRPYLIEAMEAASDELLKIMRKYVSKTVEGNGPGKPEWRRELDADLHRLHVNVADYYAEAAVGADYQEGSPDIVRAMLIAHGGGSAAGNPPIQAGPYGRPVWDEDLHTDRHPSLSQSEYLLPEKFNQPGNMFLEKAEEEFSKKLNSIMMKALGRIPSSVYMDCLVGK